MLSFTCVAQIVVLRLDFRIRLEPEPDSEPNSEPEALSLVRMWSAQPYKPERYPGGADCTHRTCPKC